MVVAHPIVSHASRCFTRFCSFIILFDEKASASVTARGSPSGTATASTVMATTMYSMRTSRTASLPIANPLMQFTRRESAAAPVPAMPICLAIFSSLVKRGDSSSPSRPSPSWSVESYTWALIFPATLDVPTAITIILAEPWTAVVPLMTTSPGFLAMRTDSPVSDDSSILSPPLVSGPRTTQSAGMLARLCEFTLSMSPTTMSSSMTLTW
mmetsp:Transcript_52446/g.111419  ORF Transcript_52446/g.111419 Transcript_52446/m.111419 type:complete len:211 (+) Transcript_52446:838-1470(+)